MINIVDWRFTSKCDNYCLYCYAHTNCIELKYEDKIFVLDKLIREGCERVCLTGGEPLFNSQECVDFIKYAYSKGVKIHLSTNGLHYLENLNEIHNKIVRLSLPLDGYDPKSNSCNGRKSTAFDTVINILKSVVDVENNPYIKINSTITGINCSIENLLKIYQVIKEYPINHWEIYEFIPENRGEENICKLKLNSRYFEELEREFRDIINTSDFKIEFSSRKSRDSRYFIIQPDGSVITPVDNSNTVQEVIVGNLLKEEYSVIEKRWEEISISDLTFQNNRILQSIG